MAGLDQTIYRTKIADVTEGWTDWEKSNGSDLTALAKSIARGQVVAYIGAGPSMATKGMPKWGEKAIPGWRGLCKSLFEWAKQDPLSPLKPADFCYLDTLLTTEKYPLFCQIVDNAYSGYRQGQLGEFLRNKFSTDGLEAPQVYRAIAMLPVALRLTTNYEDLLERTIASLPPAYGRNAPAETAILTWKHGSRILELVRNGEPGVVKLHGDINGDDGIILTKNHYRSLSSDLAFTAVLKALLSTRTFLFIGCSMTDPDIFALLDEVIEECQFLRYNTPRGKEWPPLHYALLSEESRPAAFVRHLRNDYRIATLPVTNGGDGLPDLIPLLRLIGGAVASEVEPASREFLPVFDFRSAKEQLSELVQITGSDRSDLVLIDDEETHELRQWFNWDLGRPVRDKQSRWRPTPKWGVISSTFTEEADLLYAPNLNRDEPPDAGYAAERSESEGAARRGEYYRWDEKSCSELAVPIKASGNRVGVLNIESYFSGAYSDGHLKYLKRQAERIGAQFLEAAARDRLVKEGTDHLRSEKGVLFFLSMLRNLYVGAEEIRGVLYTPSYMDGVLHGSYYDSGTEIRLEHRPYEDAPSFARTVFQERKFHVEKVTEAIRDGRIDAAMAARVGLESGPLFGCQVFDREFLCGVLVLWARQDGYRDVIERRCKLLDPSHHRLLATAANLIVAGSRREEALSAVIDQVRELNASETYDSAYETAAAAVKALGLTRLRVWKYEEQSEIATVIYTWPETYTVRGHEESSNEDSAKYSKYCEMTVSRYKTNPWARLQGPNVNRLGEDPLRVELQKPLGADWIVVPVVLNAAKTAEGNSKLWGYLAADAIPAEQWDKCDRPDIPAKDRNWLQCGLSAISVALANAKERLGNEARRAQVGT